MNAPNAKRVLFVDDEEGVRASWGRYFSQKGYDVATAPSVRHALNSLAERPADVVVSDYRMPGADGLQLLEQVREKHPDTPFIVLTGYGSEDIANEALRKGAYAYLHKPVDPETLTGTLNAALDFRFARNRALPTDLPTIAAAMAAGEAVAAAPAQALAATMAAPAAEAAPQTMARVTHGLKVAGSLVAAPLVGLAFVMFFPIIGFAALFKVLGEAGWKLIQKSRVQSRAEA